MITTPPAGADPRHRQAERNDIAVGILLGVFVTILLGAVAGTAVYRGDAPILDLLGVLVLGLFAGGTALLIRAVDRRSDRRRRHLLWAAAVFGVAMVLWILAVDLLIVNLYLPALVAGSFTSGFALWVLRKLDRNEKERWRLVLVAFGWGSVVAVNIALLMNTLWSRLITAGLVPGPGSRLSTAFSAGLFEEGGKGIAIVLVFLVMRDQFDDVVDGIVLGAAVGVGFNFMETALYASREGPGAIIGRQFIDLFNGHATYTALTGAGLGIARQQRERLLQALAIGAGFLCAITAHFAWDAYLFNFIVPGANPLGIMFMQRLLLNWPWTAAVLALLVLGLRAEARGLRAEMEAESRVGDGAILPHEVPILLSPRRRARERRRVLFRGGWRNYRLVARLQAAQIALAMERWHRTRLEIDEPLAAEVALRRRAASIRAAVGLAAR